jgi:glucokinase
VLLHPDYNQTRNRVTLRPNDPAEGLYSMNAPLLLGIEIGGTKLQLGLGRGDGTIVALERRQVIPGRGAEGIRAQICEATSILLGRGDERPVALGIGFGGPVDAARGVVTVSHQIDGWADYPIAEWASEALRVPVVTLQNDADTAALGEARFGAGVGHNPVLYVTIGSGIGGGLVVDGAIYRGSGRGATEIGHLIVTDATTPPTTLEGIASGWSIARNARRLWESNEGPSTHLLARLCEGDPARVSTLLVAEAARLGDSLSASALDEARSALGRALAHAVTLLAPSRIILGGGVSLIGEELWFEPIRRVTEALVFPPFRGTYDIVPAALGEEVVIHGALALALDAARNGPQGLGNR